jgi:hypothetical protein
VITQEVFPETPERAGQALISSILDYDARGVMRYLSDQEAQFLKIDESVMDEFLQRYVRRQLAGYRRKGLPRTDMSKAPTRIDVVQPLEHPDGRTMNISVSMCRMDEGIRANTLLYYIASSAASADRGNVPWPYDVARRQDLLRRYEAQLPLLESLRLPGVAIRKEEGSYDLDLVTWTGRRDSMRSSIERELRRASASFKM